MNLHPSGSDIREESHGHTLTELRWRGGRLQAGYTAKVTRYEGRRLLDTRTVVKWQDVPGDMPQPGPRLISLAEIRDAARQVIQDGKTGRDGPAAVSAMVRILSNTEARQTATENQHGN